MSACFSFLTVLRLWSLVLLLLAPPRAAGIAAIILDGCDRQAAKQRLCGVVGSALGYARDALEHMEEQPRTAASAMRDLAVCLEISGCRVVVRCTAVQPVVTSAQEVHRSFWCSIWIDEKWCMHNTHTHTHTHNQIISNVVKRLEGLMRAHVRSALWSDEC
jgi:hypothetical protein